MHVTIGEVERRPDVEVPMVEPRREGSVVLEQVVDRRHLSLLSHRWRLRDDAPRPERDRTRPTGPYTHSR